jgi:L-amino acid N-acyltransferase YncA
VTTVEIRPATQEDLAAILAIYNFEVMNGVATFDLAPRTMAAQLQWLEEHALPYSATVAVVGGEVLGFGALSRYREKAAYDLTVEDTVYVHQDHRREGIGRILLEDLVLTAGKRGFHAVLGRITGENEASIELHRRAGFFEAGREREVGRKFDRWLDVVTMQILLG